MHDFITRAAEEISFIHFIPSLITGLFIVAWFLVKRLFTSVDASTSEIRQIMIELGKLQGENERQWKNIEEMKAHIREISK